MRGGWLAALALACACNANAAPIIYDLTFDSGEGMPDGTGVFVWHEDTQRISNFMWDFGPGMAGGFFDSYWDHRDGGIGDPWFSIYVHGLLTSENPRAPGGVCDEPTHQCRWPVGGDENTVWGWPWSEWGYIDEITYFDAYGVVGYNIVTQSLTVIDGVEQWSVHHIAGLLSATPREAPEPETLALMAIGLVGLVAARRRRASSSSQLA